MDERRKRLPTPKPASPIPESLPPIDREHIAQWLSIIDQRLTEQNRRHESEHDEYERRLLLIERGILRIETIENKIDAFHKRLWEGHERDLSTAEEISRIRTEIAREATDKATKEAKVTGTRAGQTYGALAGLLAILLAFIEHCGKVVEAIKKMP